MEIRASWGEYVAITPIYVPYLPRTSLYCSCAMAAGRFAGATEPDEPIVQIERSTLRQFLDDLRTLERDRRGEARLTSAQLTLSVRVFDRAGHVSITAELTDYHRYGDRVSIKDHVSIIFELDPTTLPKLISDFEELLAFPRHNPETTSDS